MTSATHTMPTVPYVERVAQIICNGLYPEIHAAGKQLVDFPKSTRENLLTIAEAILLATMPPASCLPSGAPEPAAGAKAPGWVPVSTKPSAPGDYLVFRPTAHLEPACDPSVCIREYLGHNCWGGSHAITHWMPLPAAPQSSFKGKA